MAVLNITDNNADFERFRQVERELYNTERELDFMHRTGEFRNRMETEANTQQIASAQTAEQLRHALAGVNKDQLLHDDELEEFVLLLKAVSAYAPPKRRRKSTRRWKTCARADC